MLGLITLAITGGLALQLIVLFFAQAKMIFLPDVLSESHRFQFSHRFEELWVEVDNQKVGSQKINSLYFHADQPKGVILYFHGNAGSLASWGEVAAEVVRETSWDVWVLDYPGYGKSKGPLASEEELHRIGQAFLQKLRASTQLPIVLYGRSIGSGIAAHLAADVATEDDVQGLILETPYFSLVRLAREKMFWVPAFLVRYPFRSDHWLKEVKVPILIVHGEKDDLIPIEHGRDLAAQASTAKFRSMPNAGHNDLSIHESYWLALREFLEGF